MRLEGLGQNLKRGTGTEYGQGDFTQSELTCHADHINTLKTWLDNALLKISDSDNVPDTSGMIL